jgi:hypothetical protein
MKITLFIATIALYGSAYAQEYKKIKIGFTVGAFNSSLVGAACVDGAYRLNDRMAVGYRMETAALTNNSVNSSGFIISSIGVEKYSGHL